MENDSIIVLKAGSLEKEVITLQSKDQEEALYYAFSLEKRIGKQTIKSVSWTSIADDIDVSNITTDKQTFQCLISGGTNYQNVGITFKVITSAGETRTFNSVLPIRPAGIMEAVGNNTVIVLGNSQSALSKGEKGDPGQDGESYLNDGSVDLDVKSATIGGYSPVLNIPFIERDITLTYTQTTATGKQYYVPKFQDNLFGKTVSQIGVTPNKDNGTLTISLIDRPDISINKLNVIKQTVLTTKKSQYWYDLNWHIEENQSIAVCYTTDTAGITFTDASDINREIFLAWTGTAWNDYQYNGSIKTADLNIGFKIANTENEEILANKKVVILGDSISSFKNFCVVQSNYQSYPQGDITHYNQTWMSKFIQKAGGNIIYNDSRGSSGVTTNGVAANSLTARTNIPSYTDVCLVFMGINDFNGGSIAKLGDFDPTKTTFDNSIFSDAMCTSILALQAAAPKCKLIWVTPLRRFNSDGTPSLSSENISLNTWTDRIIEICNYYGVETVDMRGVGINGSNQTLYFADGVHPGNEECTQLIANYLYRNLNNLF